MDLLSHKYFIQNFLDISYWNNFLLDKGGYYTTFSEKNQLQFSMVFTEMA